MKISRQNILKIVKGKSLLEMHEGRDKCNSMIRIMEEDWAWWNMQCGNQIPSQQHKRVQIWGSIQIYLQCLHTLARSPYTGVCMPIGNLF